MTDRYQAVSVAIRAINQKLSQTKRKSTRQELNDARDFFANDPVFDHDRLSEIADSLTAHGRDEGGFDEEGRQRYYDDADFLRSLLK